MNALILAGSRGPDDPMARAAGVSHKALLPVAGVPMLLRVVEALRATVGVRRIYVCIEDARVIFQVPGLEALHRARVLETAPAAESPAASLAAALRRIDLSQPLLVTTGDHPLLTPAILQRFLDSAPADCDLAVALAPEGVVSAAYPGAIRTFYKLGKQRFSGCNLFLARSPDAVRAADFWRRTESYRKSPLRLLWQIGPLAAIKIL
ncbi:MAG: NTP transferase domain-containing protein, partial [Dongiaceae bacterium]